jgi:Domain of unknown function (DUF4124)
MRLVFIALALYCIALPASAQIYKWVDQNGVTHYGEKPPSDTKAKEMTLSSGGGSPAPTKGPQDYSNAVREKGDDFKRRQIAREETEAKEAKQKSERAQWCIQAKDNLEQMRNAGCL